MPDDLNQEEVAEQVKDVDFGDGFDDKNTSAPAPKTDANIPPADGTPTTTTAAAGEESQDTGKDKDVDAPPDKGAKPDAAKSADEKTAQQKLEDRAAAAGGAAPPPVATAPPAEQPSATPPPADAKSGEAASDDWMAKLLELPEVSGIKIGDGTTIKDFAAEYPEAVQAPVAIAKVLVDKIAASMSQEMQKMQSAINGFAFWDGVQQAHSDARKVVKTPEFKAWVDKQSPLVRKMIHSEDVEDAVSVLDAYKEALAKDDKDGRSAEAAKRKAAKDALHGETLRGTRGVQGAGGKNKAEDDFDAGFNAQS